MTDKLKHVGQYRKSETAREAVTCSSRRDCVPAFAGDLEVKLQCKLHYATATLGLDLTEVVDRSLSKVEATSRIANIGCIATVSGRTADRWSSTDRVQRQVDVTVIRVC